jgi:hypothetical protein
LKTESHSQIAADSSKIATANALPFSITPDAEDFLRSQIKEMPEGVRPVLNMTMEQSDVLNPSQWSYKGESFVIGYFDRDEQPKMECKEYKMFGRHVAIETNALNHLSGRFLGLRRVDANYGLMRNTRYVLVADSAPESSANTSSVANGDKVRRNFVVAALTILGGFTGMGVFWLIYGFIAGALKIPVEKIFQMKTIFLLFPPGWILGAIISFFFFRSVYKTDGRTRFKQEQIQTKYFGYGGLGAETDWWIFLGIPLPLTLALILFLVRFAHESWEICAITIVSIMAVFGPCLYFSDKMPRRLLLKLGILGWVVIFMGGYLFFKIHGP